MFFFAHLILSTLVLFKLFFYIWTISEVDLDPNQMSEVEFFAKIAAQSRLLFLQIASFLMFDWVLNLPLSLL